MVPCFGFNRGLTFQGLFAEIAVGKEQVTGAGFAARDAELVYGFSRAVVRSAREQVGSDGMCIVGEAVPEPEFDRVGVPDVWDLCANAAAGEVDGMAGLVIGRHALAGRARQIAGNAILILGVQVVVA